MHSSLEHLARLLETSSPRVVVSDLDGVLRVFDPGLWSRLDSALEAAEGTAFTAILGNPYLHQLIRGRGSHAQWRGRAVEALIAAGAGPSGARRTVEEWQATPAVVDEAVRGALLDARERGLAVWVFTNGTDQVRQEIAALGLDDVVGADGRYLLNSHELGHAKPDAEAFAAAQRRIEDLAGEAIDPGQVVFLDDSVGHVAGARRHGWQALLHPGAER